MNWMVKMATKMVRVNTLAVAKRWLNQMKEAYHESHQKKLGIWEKARLTCTAKAYGYTDSSAYIVGHCKCVENKISHLGKRIA